MAVTGGGRTGLVLVIFSATLIGGAFGFQQLQLQRHKYLVSSLERFESLRDQLQGITLKTLIKDKSRYMKAIKSFRSFQILCRRIIVSCPQNAVEHSVPDSLWRFGFYELVEHHRKTSAQKEEFLLLLAEGSGFYITLVHQLEARYKCEYQTHANGFQLGFDDQPTYPNYSSHGTLSANDRAASEIVYDALVHAGDLARYYGQSTNKMKLNNGIRESMVHFGIAKRYYDSALQFHPGKGCSYNQFAVLAAYEKDFFNAGYYYIRNVSSCLPFSSALQNLEKVFRMIQNDSCDNDENFERDGQQGDQQAKLVCHKKSSPQATPHQSADPSKQRRLYNQRNYHLSNTDESRVVNVLHTFAYLHVCLYFDEGIEGILWKRWRKQDGFLFKYLPTVIRDAITFKPEQSTKFIMSTLPLILLVYTLFVLDHCLQTNTNSKAAIELFLDLMHILVSIGLEGSNTFVLSSIKIACGWLRTNSQFIRSTYDKSKNDDQDSPLHRQHPFWENLAVLGTQHAANVPPQPSVWFSWKQTPGTVLPEDKFMFGLKALRSDPYFAELEKYSNIHPVTSLEMIAAVRDRTITSGLLTIAEQAQSESQDMPLVYRSTEDGLVFKNASAVWFHTETNSSGPSEENDDEMETELFGVMESIMTSLDDEEDYIGQEEA
eukprot:gene8753-1136_t